MDASTVQNVQLSILLVRKSVVHFTQIDFPCLDELEVVLFFAFITGELATEVLDDEVEHLAFFFGIL